MIDHVASFETDPTAWASLLSRIGYLYSTVKARILDTTIGKVKFSFFLETTRISDIATIPCSARILDKARILDASTILDTARILEQSGYYIQTGS